MSKKAPKTLTRTETKELLDCIQYSGHTDKSKRKGIRNHAIALLMLDAGLRVGEVVQLTQSDLWFYQAPVKTLTLQAELTKTKYET